MSGISSLAKDFESKSKQQAQSLQEALTAELQSIEKSLKKESSSSAERIKSVIQANEKALMKEVKALSQTRLAAVQRVMNWVLVATSLAFALLLALSLWIIPNFYTDLNTARSIKGIEIVEQGVNQQGTRYIIIQNQTRQIENNETVIFLQQE